MSKFEMEVPLPDEKQMRTVSRSRKVLPQVLAMAAANCVIMDMAVTFFFSTLVIADLHDPSKELSFDDTQASWFGGLPYLCQPIGSIASGFLVTWFGRKRSLMLITLPYILSCILMSTASSVYILFLTNIVIGITVGFTEAPINNYFGEICQPELRSILAGSASLYYQFGMFFELLLGSFLHWRTTAAVSVVMPILTLLFLSRVPESPIWLVAQGRKKDAEDALCWLRGWVDPSSVQQELAALVRYYETVIMASPGYISKPKEDTVMMQTLDVTNNQWTPEQTDLLPHNGEHYVNNCLTTKQTTDDDTSNCIQNSEQMHQVEAFNFVELHMNPEQPVLLTQSRNKCPSSHVTIRQTTENIEATISRKKSATIAENDLLSEVILEGRKERKHDTRWSKFVAKAKLFLEPETLRPLILVFLVFTFSGMGGMLSVKPFMVEVLQRFQSPLDPKWSSVLVAAAGFLGSVFLIVTVRALGKRLLGLSTTAACAVSCLLLGLYAFVAIKPARDTGDVSYPVATWVPLALFALLSFAATVQGQLPWLLVAESFPFRTRGIAGGLSAASMYLVAFFASKTYLVTEQTFQLHGTFWIFGVINCTCFVYLYFQLPETEGKSLEEIESLYAGNKPRTSINRGPRIEER